MRISLAPYLTSNSNKFFKSGNDWCGKFDDGGFKLGYHAAALGAQTANLTGNTDAAHKCRSVANGFEAARAGIGAIRFIFPIHKLLTGQMFWHTDSKGWRRVEQKDGRAERIPAEELGSLWKKHDGVWHNIKTRKTSLDGKYIESKTGIYLARDWMDIAMDICVLVARLISPLRWLHNLKVIDLGRHAKALGGVVLAAWSIVLSINLVQSIQGLIEDVELESMQKKIWDTFQSFVDLLALPFEFGIGSGHPTLAMVGTGVNLLSAASLIAKDIVYYS